jgi:hypothetical protein
MIRLEVSSLMHKVKKVMIFSINRILANHYSSNISDIYSLTANIKLSLYLI